MKIEREVLIDMLYNVYQFAQLKTVVDGYTLWFFIPEGPELTAVATNDCVIYVERLPVLTDDTSKLWLIHRKDIHAAMEELKKSDAEMVEWPIDGALEMTESEVQEDINGGGLMYLYELAINVIPIEKPPYVRFAVGPEHFKKLSLLRLQGYPVDFMWAVDGDFSPTLAFKVGPYAQGIIAPLDREALISDDAYGGALWDTYE